MNFGELKKSRNNIYRILTFNSSTISFTEKNVNFYKTVVFYSICHILFSYSFLFPDCFYQSQTWYRRIALTFKIEDLECHELHILNYTFQLGVSIPSIFIHMKEFIQKVTILKSNIYLFEIYYVSNSMNFPLAKLSWGNYLNRFIVGSIQSTTFYLLTQKSKDMLVLSS